MSSSFPDTTSTVVQTERLLLRPLRPEDREAFIDMHEVSRDHLAPWSPRMAEGQTFADLFEEQLERSTRWEAEGRMCRRVGILDDGSMVGVFTLDQIHRGPFLNGIAGWRVSVEHINKGYCSEAMQGLLDIAFAPDGLSLHRIEASIIPANVASVRVAQKLGFRHEGLSIAYLKIDGQWQEHARFAKLIDEHEQRYQLQK